MKNLLKFLLFCALFWGFGRPSAQASHFLGSDLTWSCDPNNTCLYTFTYTYYQDCPTVAGVYEPGLLFTCPGQTGPTPTSLPGWNIKDNGTDITPLCAGQTSTCNGGTFPGVEQFVLSKTYNFCTTPTCSQWQVDWSACCRSNQITSLSNPSGTAIGTTSLVAFDPNNCNNSPTFNASPSVYLCNGQTTNYSMGATDSDGDQLVYTLIACQGSPQYPLNYAPGYSATAPLGANWNVTLDQNTGDLTFTNNTPTTLLAVLCVRVDEIRNGQVIGSVVRDMQIRVINCSNNLPTLTGLDGNTDYTSKACIGTSNCFDIFSNDADLGDNLSVSLVNGPPGLTLTTAGSPHPTATVCWTPTANDIGLNTFILEVSDDACPLTGVQQYTYTLEVTTCDPCDLVNVNVSWTHTQSLLDITVTNTTTGGPVSFTEFIWNDGSSNDFYPGNYTSPVNHTFPASGTYNVCVKTYTYIDDICCHDSVCMPITVTNDPCEEFDASWYAQGIWQNPCTLTFFDSSTPGSSTILWDFGAGGPLVQGSPASYTFPGSGTYTITMYATYHPPGNPQLCCYDTSSSTFNLSCTIKDTKGEGGSYGKVAWNQFSSILEVQLEKPAYEVPSTVAIYDLSGKLLFEQTNITGSEAAFDFSGVASGIYLIRTITGDKIETRKFARP